MTDDNVVTLQCVVDISEAVRNFGRRVVWCADINGDGVLDVAILFDRALDLEKVLRPDQVEIAIASGVTGAVLQSVTPEMVGAQLGRNFVALRDDVDDDVSQRRSNGGSGLIAVSVWIDEDPPGWTVVHRGLPSASGGVRRRCNATLSHDSWAMSVIGDVNGDGVEDYAQRGCQLTELKSADAGGSAAGYSPIRSSRECEIISGADNSVLLTMSSPETLIGSVAGGGDVDCDGTPDVLLFGYATADDHSGPQGARARGCARVHSGKNGDELVRLVDETVKPGAVVMQGAIIGDVDGDHCSDVAIGTPMEAGEVGAVRVFSGKSGALIHVMRGRDLRDRYGSAVASVPDVDGDGVDDLLVGAPQVDDIWTKERRADPGYCQVVSGATGELITQFGAPQTASRFGQAVDVLRRIDPESGRQDALIAIGAPAESFEDGGAVFIFRLECAAPRLPPR